MALDLFRVIDGLAIQLDDQSDEAWQLIGDGAPSGTSGRTADAPVGSLWLQTDAETDGLNLYWKHQDTDSPVDWKQAASKDYVDTAVQGISWREPAKYLDGNSYITVAAALADMNPDDILTGEGTVAAGDRILFPAMGAPDGGPNVFIVGGSSGSWTLTEDTNDETDGDAILINEGSSADQQWIYDGTTWIQFGGAGSATELTNIRNYIGKPTSGAIFPQYQSNQIVSDNDDLTEASGKLDLHLGDAQYSSNNAITDFTPDYTNTAPTNWTGETGDNITNAIGALDATLGNGLITNIGTNYSLSDEMSWNAAGTLTQTDALNELNNAIGDRTYTNDFLLVDGETVASSLDTLDSTLGDLDNSSAYTTGGLLDNTTIAGNNVQTTLDSFNQELGEQNTLTQEFTGTATATTTTSLVPAPDRLSASSDATEIKWLLQLKNAGGDRRAMEIHAITDGTNVDFTTYAVVKVGSPLTNFDLDVTLTGGNWDVTIGDGATTPAAALTYTLKRMSYSYLA